jgi:hypothetical protein
MKNGHKYEHFDSDLLEELKEEMTILAEQGVAPYFQIKINDRIIVARTNEVSRFDYYHDFMNERTRSVQVTIYRYPGANSRHSDNYHFYTPLYFVNAPQSGLGQLMETRNNPQKQQELEATIQEALAKERRQNHLVTMEKELEALKQQLAEAEETIALQYQQLEALSNDKLKIKNIHLGELGGAILENLLARQMPLLQGYMGAFSGAEPSETTPDVNQVSCKLSGT